MKKGNPVWSIKLVREKTPNYKISGTDDVYQVCREAIFPELLSSNVEKFYFIGLNTCNQVLIIDEHTRGGVSEARVYISEIAKKLLLTNCSQVILIHNHPSGNLEASDSDIMLTNKISEALKFFEIKVLDHLITGLDVNDYISFKETGLL